jgi:dihydrofolate reductase
VLIGIVATGPNGVIGKDSGLPWHLPDDLKRFKELTSGHSILMGRHTFESLGRFLPNRHHIILSRNHNYIPPFDLSSNSSYAVITDISNIDTSPVFVVGGAEVYRLLLPLCQKLYWTSVLGKIDGDTRIDPPNPHEWYTESSVFHPADAKHSHAFFMCELLRV